MMGPGRKRIAVIGATGSVGSSVLDVCRAHPDALEVRALAARSPSEKLTALAAEFGVTTTRRPVLERRDRGQKSSGAPGA